MRGQSRHLQAHSTRRSNGNIGGKPRNKRTASGGQQEGSAGHLGAAWLAGASGDARPARVKTSHGTETHVASRRHMRWTCAQSTHVTSEGPRRLGEGCVQERVQGRELIRPPPSSHRSPPLRSHLPRKEPTRPPPPRPASLHARAACRCSAHLAGRSAGTLTHLLMRTDLTHHAAEGLRSPTNTRDRHLLNE